MKLNLLAVSFFGLVLSGCQGQITSTLFEKGKPLSEVTDKRLKEASGLVASRANKGMLWTHNDSGNDAEIYLINEKLDIIMTVTLQGIANRDWEDITLGPGPDASKTYLYIGDIGDNDAEFPVKYIYRLPEPVFSGEQNVSVSSFDRITFKLEDGVKDTESLFIDSKSKNLYVVSKREEPVTVYELPYVESSDDTLTASKILTLPYTKIVAAERNLETGEILMKNYEHIYYWENKNGEDIASLLKKKPVMVLYEKEPQGESIAWSVDGRGFYTISEKKKKQPSYLYFYSRK